MNTELLNPLRTANKGVSDALLAAGDVVIAALAPLVDVVRAFAANLPPEVVQQAQQYAAEQKVIGDSAA